MAESSLGPLLGKLEYCRSFNPGDREALLALPHEVKKIGLGNYIVRDGDLPVRCAVMISGYVYRHKIVAGGRGRSCHFTCAGIWWIFRIRFSALPTTTCRR